ncbi:MAG: zinc-binding dehydrogenase, partial [Mycobacterium sp.]|nr:zinc-binding dehydrogenase [Mycobacterium sp.]
VRIPAHWSFEQAASIPVAFATAYYCLADIAELRAGESVLIHAGTGAVGMAAIQLARHWGAEVYATASHSKHDALRSMGLDDNHIADSRNPGFAARFRAATAGRGVDVVVNSLSGRLIDAGLGLLAAGGRFVEIGKTDIRDADAVAATYPGVSYYVFDLLQCDPRRTGDILAEVTNLYQRAALAPLAVRAWDVRQAPEALRFMSQARHTGKLVLTVPSIPSTPGLDGTVLITGGTGTLGGLVATHLVSHYGVRNLVLVSRRGPAAKGADQLHEQLCASGARVDIIACDIADSARVAEV